MWSYLSKLFMVQALVCERFEQQERTFPRKPQENRGVRYSRIVHGSFEIVNNVWISLLIVCQRAVWRKYLKYLSM